MNTNLDLCFSVLSDSSEQEAGREPGSIRTHPRKEVVMRVLALPVTQSRQSAPIWQSFQPLGSNEDPLTAQNSELVAELGESKDRSRLTAAISTSTPATENLLCWPT